jgi:hypothetical protein
MRHKIRTACDLVTSCAPATRGTRGHLEDDSLATRLRCPGSFKPYEVS